jgi:hypothetical protein
MKGDCTPRGFEHVGKTIFCAKVKRRKKKHESPGAEDETEEDAPWSTDFLLREGLSREEIGKWLKNKSIPWQRRRRLLQVVTGTFPYGHWMLKYGYKRTAGCALCKKVHEEVAAGTDSCQRRQLAIFRVWGALDKRRWSLQHTMRASGNCYRKSMYMGRRTVT